MMHSSFREINKQVKLQENTKLYSLLQADSLGQTTKFSSRVDFLNTNLSFWCCNLTPPVDVGCSVLAVSLICRVMGGHYWGPADLWPAGLDSSNPLGLHRDTATTFVKRKRIGMGDWRRPPGITRPLSTDADQGIETRETGVAILSVSAYPWWMFHWQTESWMFWGFCSECFRPWEKKTIKNMTFMLHLMNYCPGDWLWLTTYEWS